MKIKLLALASIVMMSCISSADLLYWQVNNTEVANAGITGYEYAAIFVDPASGDDAILSSYYGEATPSQYIGKQTFGTTSVGADITSYGATGNSFYIELYNEANNVVGRSSSMDYSSLTDYISQAEFSSSWKSMAATPGFGMSGVTYNAVPEPTSGLMLLVGMAMLGLRRRKVA